MRNQSNFEDNPIQFPGKSVNDDGEIVDLQLWIDEFEKYFEDKVLSEIQISIEIGLQTAPYILISCAIDFLVTFWAGKESSKNHYKKFVEIYFDGYNGENLYKELRCRLVHNHTVGEKTIICWDEPDIHRQTLQGEIFVLNLEQFYNDFLQAVNKYFSDLRTKPDLKNNHINRFHEMGVLDPIDPNEIRDWRNAI